MEIIETLDKYLLLLKVEGEGSAKTREKRAIR